MECSETLNTLISGWKESADQPGENGLSLIRVNQCDPWLSWVG